MKVMVLGGTGTVGSNVVRELTSRGVEVRVLTRDPEKAKSLPPGVQAVRGDLLDPATVRSVFAGMDGVFLLNGLSPTETHEGLMAVNGARLANVARIAYLSVQDVDKAPHLPHFGSKIAVEAAVKESGIAFTILRPNNFFQNDLTLKEAMLRHGVYPQPIGDVGVSRVDVRDIAEAAALALADGGHAGQTYNIVGPVAHTGATTAEAWSAALGRNVAYAGNDLDAWEKQARQVLPPWLAFDLRLMYAYFQRNGLRASAADIDRQTKLLGHAPRRFEDFVAETARSWSGRP